MELLLMDKEVACATRGRLSVMSLTARLNVAAIDRLMEAAAPHRARFGAEAVLITVVRPNVALPDEATRAHIQRTNQRHDSAAVSYIVVDSSGFWAAALRGLLASVALVSKKAPHAAASVGEALQKITPWLDAQTGTADELAPLIEDFRRRHLAFVEGAEVLTTGL